MLKKFCISACMLMLLLPVQAQQFDELLGKYDLANGRDYFRPLLFGIRQGFFAGYAFDAHIPKRAFQVRLSLHGTATFFPSSTHTYQATTDSYFTPQQTVEVPTVVGSREGVSVTGDGGAVYRFPGGAGIGMVPVVVPQITFGGFLGMEVGWRVGYYGSPEFGRVILGGGAYRISLSQFFGPEPPFDLTFGVNGHSLSYSYLPADLSGVRSFNQFEYGPLILAGKSWKAFHVYGGANFSAGRTILSFASLDSNIPPFGIDTGFDTNVSATAGAGVNLHPFFLAAGGTFGRVTVVHTAIGFTLGKKETTGSIIRTPLTPTSL